MLFASLRKYADSIGHVITADVSDEIDIEELLTELEIDTKEVKTVTLNGNVVSMKERLSDGDRISISP